MSARDLLGADDVLRSDEQRMAGLRFLLVDHTLAHGLSADTDGIRRLAERGKSDAEIVPAEQGVIAIAAPGLVLYGMTRMWMFMSNTPFECNVFRDRDETLTWLADRVHERAGIEIDFSDAAFGHDLRAAVGRSG